MSFLKPLWITLLTALALALSATAHADDTTTTATVKEVVEAHLPADVRDHFIADAKASGVDYDKISDVELTVDKTTGSVTVVGQPAKHQQGELIFVGVHLGMLLPFGLDGTLMLTKDDHPEWDVDVSWEPSNYLQSYSIGGAYHPFHNAFFIGARIRELQLHAPWSRGYDARLDNQFGVGPELGFRGWFDRSQHWLGSISVGAIFVPSGNTDLPVLYTLNVGLAYRAWRARQ